IPAPALECIPCRFFFSSRRRRTRFSRDWSSDVCSSDLEALIQHEVGTHIATYFNGKVQPLQLFSLGVPGYEKLQEGLAVFSEYMVDGLSNERLKILAARVICVRHMLMGNFFVDTFSLLVV